jgi:outer membrane lipoprotein carrier protein
MLERRIIIVKSVVRIFLLFAAFISAASFAQSAEDEGRRLLNRFVNDVASFSARFEQQLVDADGEVVEESDGTMEIQRPGRFRWSYDRPYEQVMVADGMNVWSYDVDLAQVTVKSQAEVLSNTPALLLGGSHGALGDFDFVGSDSDRDTVWVTLQPKTSENGFTKIELGFNEGELRRMVFSDNLQQSTLIALFDLQINPDIPDDHFVFIPADDVDVVGVPVANSIGSTD